MVWWKTDVTGFTFHYFRLVRITKDLDLRYAQRFTFHYFRLVRLEDAEYLTGLLEFTFHYFRLVRINKTFGAIEKANLHFTILD